MCRFLVIFLMLLLCAPTCWADDEADVDEAEEKPTLEDIPLPPPMKGPNALVTERGSRVQGKFEGIKGGKFVFNDPELGKVNVKSGNVRSLLLRDPYRIWFQETRESPVKEGRMAPLFYHNEYGDLRIRIHSFSETGLDDYLYADPARLHELRLSSYTIKAPEWKFTGNISGSLEWADGNRTRINYGVASWFRLHHKFHKFDVRQGSTFAETDSVRSAQRVNLDFSYRYLFTTHNAVFVKEVLYHDDFAKLAVRSITSAGLTFYFYKEADITWSIDAGASYTEEHRKENIPNRYSDGGQFSMRVDGKPKEDIRVRASTRATIPFDFPKEAIITSQVNVSFTLWEGLTFAIDFRHNHDSEPPRGVEHNDYNLRFLLGWNIK